MDKSKIKLLETLEETVEFVIETIIAVTKISSGFYDELDEEVNNYLMSYAIIIRQSIQEQSDEFKLALLHHYKMYPLEVITLMVNNPLDILPSDFDFLTEDDKKEADDLSRTFMATVGKHLEELLGVSGVITEESINHYFLERDILLNQFEEHNNSLNELLQ